MPPLIRKQWWLHGLPGIKQTQARMTWRMCAPQDFSEKPKGDALEQMKVDTTLLGACLPQTYSAGCTCSSTPGTPHVQAAALGPKRNVDGLHQGRTLCREQLQTGACQAPAPAAHKNFQETGRVRS